MFRNKDNRLGKIHSLLWIICLESWKYNFMGSETAYFTPRQGILHGF